MPTIAILGGGLAGRLTAFQLAEQGLQTTLFEQSNRQGEGAAAYIAAAMLAPLAESIEATPQVITLGKQSLPQWRSLIQHLPTPVYMQQSGSLIVWHRQDAPLSKQFEQHLRRASQTPHPAQHWHTTELSTHEPQLAQRFQTALYLPEEGQLDNRQALNALADGLDAQGVICHFNQTQTIAALQAHYDWVIDCRGIHAKTEWNKPSASQLRGVRGEVARVYAPEITLNRPVRLLHPRYPLYIAPKENHIFVIGATQLESESTAPTSVRSGLELLSALYAVHPAFGEAQILEIATRLRPTLNHHNPEIRYNLSQRLVEINGLFRHGFMIAPAVTAAACRLIHTLAHHQTPPQRDSQSGLPFLPLT